MIVRVTHEDIKIYDVPIDELTHDCFNKFNEAILFMEHQKELLSSKNSLSNIEMLVENISICKKEYIQLCDSIISFLKETKNLYDEYYLDGLILSQEELKILTKYIEIIDIIIQTKIKMGDDQDKCIFNMYNKPIGLVAVNLLEAIMSDGAFDTMPYYSCLKKINDEHRKDIDRKTQDIVININNQLAHYNVQLPVIASPSTNSRVSKVSAISDILTNILIKLEKKYAFKESERDMLYNIIISGKNNDDSVDKFIAGLITIFKRVKEEKQIEKLNQMLQQIRITFPALNNIIDWNEIMKDIGKQERLYYNAEKLSNIYDYLIRILPPDLNEDHFNKYIKSFINENDITQFLLNYKIIFIEYIFPEVKKMLVNLGITNVSKDEIEIISINILDSQEYTTDLIEQISKKYIKQNIITVISNCINAKTIFIDNTILSTILHDINDWWPFLVTQEYSLSEIVGYILDKNENYKNRCAYFNNILSHICDKNIIEVKNNVISLLRLFPKIADRNEILDYLLEEISLNLNIDDRFKLELINLIKSISQELNKILLNDVLDSNIESLINNGGYLFISDFKPFTEDGLNEFGRQPKDKIKYLNFLRDSMNYLLIKQFYGIKTASEIFTIRDESYWSVKASKLKYSGVLLRTVYGNFDISSFSGYRIYDVVKRADSQYMKLVESAVLKGREIEKMEPLEYIWDNIEKVVNAYNFIHARLDLVPSKLSLDQDLIFLLISKFMCDFEDAISNSKNLNKLKALRKRVVTFLAQNKLSMNLIKEYQKKFKHNL